MLDWLDAMIPNAEGSGDSVNIHTALLSVDILAASFVTNAHEAFPAYSPNVVNAPPMTLHLFGCAFVCLSSVCRAVDPVVFSLLPKFFPRLLSEVNYCSSTSNVSGTKAVLQCLLAALEVITDKIPQLLGPYLPDVLGALLSSSLLSSAPASAQVLMTVDCCILNLCNHVGLRQLLHNVRARFDFKERHERDQADRGHIGWIVIQFVHPDQPRAGALCVREGQGGHVVQRVRRRA
ncbi:hypothetical protein GN958_ATG10193 [Phytophthora infestans]|uniref:HEAT repeat-containing protein 1 n=1 Tax=Phytophthora infestans TaxID=4787 RepID=A0A8S9UJA0_PHYIN|nr:hypothetical protein GN958_ATG10193 [Phytophthora infestans]